MEEQFKISPIIISVVITIKVHRKKINIMQIKITLMMDYKRKTTQRAINQKSNKNLLKSKNLKDKIRNKKEF